MTQKEWNHYAKQRYKWKMNEQIHLIEVVWTDYLKDDKVI